MIRFYTSGLLLILINLAGYGQKVKYKELFVLLNASQFETAEPHLKRYLLENNDNPNAFYFMGVTLNEKSAKIDPLVYTEKLLSTIDSALLFLDKAHKTIDERELKRNDEYYESFSRRDIRTGKFTVKLSDIHLQLEDRMKALKDRSERIRTMKKNYTASEASYQRTQALYKQLTTPFSNERELLLRADEKALNDIKKTGEVYDSVLYFFNLYKSALQLLGKTGHNQVLTQQEIKDIKRDGLQAADFLQEDLRIWDYKTWSSQTFDRINKEIIPMKSRLVGYDIAINKLREKQKKDSVSVKEELLEISSKLQTEPLLRLDPQALPLAVMGMNVSDLEYTSAILANKKLRDSANVYLRLNCIKAELQAISIVDSIAAGMAKRDFDKEGVLYEDFISKTYGTVAVLKSNAKATYDYASREKLKRQKEWEQVSQSLKWLVADADSIPLFVEIGQETKLKPFIILEESHTAGLKYADSVAVGYFFTITPSRIPDVKVNFPVDATNFTRRNLPLIKALSTKDSNGQVFFVLLYSEGKLAEKYPATLAKINRASGLDWSNSIPLEMIPTELYYTNETGELAIKITNSSGDTKMVVVDKNGKQIQ